MKKKVLLFLFASLAIVRFTNAQKGMTFYNGPSQYTTGQLNTKRCIAVDTNDLIYVGFYGIGIGKFNPADTSWIMFDSLNSGLPTNRILSIAIDNNGDLWTGTDFGLSRFNGQAWTLYDTTNSGISNNTVNRIYAVDGGIWCGTNKGLCFFDGNTNWTTYTTQNSGLLTDTVYCIETNINGDVLAGCSKGVSVLRNSVWIGYTEITEGLSIGAVYSILSLSSNTTYFDSNYGLLKLSRNKLYPDHCKYRIPSEGAYVDNAKTMIKKGNKAYLISNANTLIRLDNNETLELLNDSTTTEYFPSFKQCVTDHNGVVWQIPYTSPLQRVCLASFNENIAKPFTTSPYPEQFSSVRYLDINNTSAAIGNKGMMFWNFVESNGRPKYEVPKCSYKTSVFDVAPWIAGYDQNKILHVSAEFYGMSASKDYQSGPLDTVTGNSDPTTRQQYDNIWKIDRSTINQFIVNFIAGNVTNGTYTVPVELLSYPAVGNGNFSRSMAPFVDTNGDENYDPYDGDYPLIKGDQQLFWIFNDLDTFRRDSNGIPLGVEVRASAYAYSCNGLDPKDVNGVLDYTTFYRYEFANRSQNNYDSVFIGLFNDMDLGDAFDDFIGCDTVLNSAFTYNADNFDGYISSPFDYKLNPPIMNCQILCGPKPEINDGIDNDHDGITDENGEMNMMTVMRHLFKLSATPYGLPLVADDHYNAMIGRFNNGEHVTIGNLGFGGSTPTTYYYSGLPYDTSGWTETSAGHIPDDRTFLVSSGPFKLAPHETKSIDFAYVFTWDSTAANGLNTSIALNKAGLQKIKDWFENDNFPCKDSVYRIPEIAYNELVLYPNPSTDQVVIRSDKNMLSYILYDVRGSLLLSEKVGRSKIASINLRTLRQGVYFVNVETEAGWKVKKLVKLLK